jgi:hypothetical protein
MPVTMGVGGLLYLTLIAAFVYAVPQMAGLSREALVPEARALLGQAAAVLRSR